MYMTILSIFGYLCIIVYVNSIKTNISIVETAAVVADLIMLEVQRSEEAQGVRQTPAATVGLSACNKGRGEIKAEVVMGISAVPVGQRFRRSRLAVECRRRKHSSADAHCASNTRTLRKGSTVPQALRLAMLP
jgi:hypothetical protein